MIAQIFGGEGGLINASIVRDRWCGLSVNGRTASTLTFYGTNDNNWNAVQTTSVVVNLNAGYNSIQFSSGSGWAPDINCISIS